MYKFNSVQSYKNTQTEKLTVGAVTAQTAVLLMFVYLYMYIAV